MFRLVAPEMMQPGGPDLNRIMLDWAAYHLPFGVSFKPGAVAIGVAEGNELLAVTAYDNFQADAHKEPLGIECSIASVSPRWVNRGTVRGILSYPFCKLGVRRVTCLIGSKNTRSRKFCEGLGFRHEGTAREALGPDEDLLVMGMLRSESRRWLGSLLDG